MKYDLIIRGSSRGKEVFPMSFCTLDHLHELSLCKDAEYETMTAANGNEYRFPVDSDRDFYVRFINRIKVKK